MIDFIEQLRRQLPSTQSMEADRIRGYVRRARKAERSTNDPAAKGYARAAARHAITLGKMLNKGDAAGAFIFAVNMARAIQNFNFRIVGLEHPSIRVRNEFVSNTNARNRRQSQNSAIEAKEAREEGASLKQKHPKWSQARVISQLKSTPKWSKKGRSTLAKYLSQGVPKKYK